MPSIDLFATAGNTRVPRFLSWLREETAVGVDAFAHSWGREVLPYAFPPFSLVGKVLDYLQGFPMVSLILIAPVWKTRPWYPILLNLLVDLPVLLGRDQNLILDQYLNPHPLSKLGTLRLAAWKLSCNPVERKGFLRRLVSSCQSVGPQGHKRHIIALGKSGLAGAIEGVVVPFAHL